MIKAAVRSLFGVAGAARCIDRLARKYDFEQTERVGPIVWGPGMAKITDKAGFLSPILVEFEGRMHPAPSNYKEILAKNYGDYLRLPPAEQRVPHHLYEVYWSCDSESAEGYSRGRVLGEQAFSDCRDLDRADVC